MTEKNFPAPRVFLSTDAEPPADVQGVRWLDWQVDGQQLFLLRGPDGWVWRPDMLDRPWQSGTTWADAVRRRPGRYEECLWLPYAGETRMAVA